MIYIVRAPDGAIRICGEGDGGALALADVLDAQAQHGGGGW